MKIFFYALREYDEQNLLLNLASKLLLYKIYGKSKTVRKTCTGWYHHSEICRNG